MSGNHNHGHAGGHGDDHGHGSALRSIITHIFVPHSHDLADSMDDAMDSSNEGIRAVKISLAGLGATAVFQLIIVLVSGSVALFADTVHNFSDALTAIPLWIAFLLGRRAPTRGYTYGFGRAEDIAGLFIVAMIALSAVVAAVESVRRFFDPQPLDNLGWVLAAGMIGFLGNELVAIYRIKVGRRIASAALVADGVHARTDGFTSLAVVLGAAGVWLGFPLADPIIGLVISAAIAILLWGTAKAIGRRLMDGVDPALVEAAEGAVHQSAPGSTVRMRWMGHRLHVEIFMASSGTATVWDAQERASELERAVRRAVPNTGSVVAVPFQISDTGIRTGGRGGLNPLERIHLFTVNDHLEVQVATGGSSGGPNEANAVTFLHGVSHTDPHAGHVIVGRLQSITMADRDPLAAAVGVPSRLGDLAIGGTLHWGTAGTGIVLAGVELAGCSGDGADSGTKGRRRFQLLQRCGKFIRVFRLRRRRGFLAVVIPLLVVAFALVLVVPAIAVVTLLILAAAGIVLAAARPVLASVGLAVTVVGLARIAGAAVHRSGITHVSLDQSNPVDPGTCRHIGRSGDVGTNVALVRRRLWNQHSGESRRDCERKRTAAAQ